TGAVSIVPRTPVTRGKTVRVIFQKPVKDVRKAARPKTPPRPPDHVEQLAIGTQNAERLTLDAPILTSLVNGEREKRRPVALSAIPDRMIHAVLAIEDHRFYDHPGVDPIGVLGAVFSYLTGRRSYLAGGSTITRSEERRVGKEGWWQMTTERE